MGRPALASYGNMKINANLLSYYETTCVSYTHLMKHSVLPREIAIICKPLPSRAMTVMKEYQLNDREHSTKAVTLSNLQASTKRLHDITPRIAIFKSGLSLRIVGLASSWIHCEKSALLLFAYFAFRLIRTCDAHA